MVTRFKKSDNVLWEPKYTFYWENRTYLNSFYSDHDPKSNFQNIWLMELLYFGLNKGGWRSYMCCQPSRLTNSVYNPQFSPCLYSMQVVLKMTDTWRGRNCRCFSWIVTLKSDSHLPKKICFIYFIESPLKMMKNAFYFILKALLVLKIFKCLSWLFGHIEKTAWLER